ncbi:MAG: trypsin-like peptidase domain-containing protein, partial [Candidatus Harrisonbacteria bacterium]|nr:trypsin-like peptidase domain-containing protein [Candidatus Harrisonbacteria bacterium]
AGSAGLSFRVFTLYKETAARAAAAEQQALETLYRFEKEQAALRRRVDALGQENSVLKGTASALEKERAKLKETLGAQSKLLDVQGQLSTVQQQKIGEQGSKIGELQQTVGTVSTELERLKKLGGEPLPKDFINSLLQATARIRCTISRSGNTVNFRAGSGSLLGRYPAVGDELVVMTNAHVIADNVATGAPQCEVVFGDGSEYAADVVKRVFDDTYDFALLKLGATKSRVAVQPVSYDDLGIGFCEVADVEVGDRITIVSYPRFTGPENAVSVGYVTNIFAEDAGPIYEGSAIIDNGSSGGVAILNKKRCALGMPTWKGLGDKLGLSYMQSWPLMLSYKKS